MIVLARAYSDNVTGLHSAVALLKEALRIQRIHLAPTDQAILATEDRRAMLQSLATQLDERG